MIHSLEYLARISEYSIKILQVKLLNIHIIEGPTKRLANINNKNISKAIPGERA
jgi:hypothetical protein